MTDQLADRLKGSALVLIRGLVLPLGPLLMVALLPLSARSYNIAGGFWFVCLFFLRDIWIRPFVRIMYKGFITRVLILPLGFFAEETCARWFYWMAWGWLVVGAGIAVTATLAPGSWFR
jgi:hypothetical protein